MNSNGAMFWAGAILAGFIFFYVGSSMTNSIWNDYLIKNGLAHYDPITADLILDKTNKKVYP